MVRRLETPIQLKQGLVELRNPVPDRRHGKVDWDVVEPGHVFDLAAAVSEDKFPKTNALGQFRVAASHNALKENGVARPSGNLASNGISDVLMQHIEGWTRG